jgi:DNA mismatch repair protein MutS
LFATHYFELTEFPRRHERAMNLHVSAAEQGERIVFLHAIEAGPASRSYGVQVARLAGMPAGLIRQARTTLEALEAQSRAGDPQVDLFAAPPPEPPAALLGDTPATPAELPAPVQALLQALADVQPDSLSPREALDALYRLKALSIEPTDASFP